MYRRVTIVNNTVLYIWEFLRVDIKSSYYMQKNIVTYVVMDVN